MSTTPDAARVPIATNSEEQTIALGMHLGGVVRAGDVVAIDGELGAGKTRLVRGIAMGFGVPESEIRSPTFALAHEYTVVGGGPGRPRLVHIDAFRLTSGDELDSIGWDGLHAPDAVVVIEWAQRIADRLPVSSYRVRIDHTGVESRRITIECPDQRGAQSLRSFGAAMQGASPIHRCRSCGRRIDTSIETFPFCSTRCKQADLGNWFSEKYRISRDVTERDLDEG